MILTAVCYVLAFVAALLAVVCKQQKTGRVTFRKGDLKLAIPAVCVAAVLCVGTILLSNGAGGESAGTSGEETANGDAAYSSPTVDESVWQGYSGDDYLLDCNADGTYTFTFVTAGLMETGTWSWQDWTFTLADVTGQVNRDFTCDVGTWGAF